jgi:hypothetical protein
MTSTLSRFAQPLTRSFVVIQSSNENGAYFFDEADIDNWYTANKNLIQKIGSLYIIPGKTSGTTFYDVLRGENGASELEVNLNRINQRRTLVDLGKEVIIGNTVDSRLLVLRRVQRPILSDEGNATDADYTGYVVVENNTEDLGADTWGRFTVRVARI